MTKQELEKSIQEIWELFRETDRRFQESDRKLTEKFKETDRILAERLKETDRILTEKFKETDQKIKEMSTAIGNLGGKWGMFVEGLLLPAVKQLFQERGIPIERVYHRSESYRNGKKMEIDILAVNGDYAVLIEVKSTLGIDDIKEHIEKLSQFRSFFPEYGDRRVIGAVAGIVIQEGADRYAYRQGLYVIGQTGETVKILNDEKFEPKVW